MPPAEAPGAEAWRKTIALLPQLDWLVEHIQRRTIGAPVVAELDSYNAAFNRLLLAAPVDVLDVVEQVQVLVFRLEQRDTAWDQEWVVARAELVRVSRAAVAELMQRRPTRLLRRVWRSARSLRRNRRLPLQMTDSEIQSRGRKLIALASAEFPKEFEVRGDADAWPFVAAALVSRMTTTLETVIHLHLMRRAVDASILVRSVYEHAVCLAWLGADPTAERLADWRLSDIKMRLVADDEATDRGVVLLTPANRAEMQDQIGDRKLKRLVLVNLADEAETEWAGRLPGLDGEKDFRSFRGLYTILYRDYSGVAHPTLRGLNPVYDELSLTGRRVRLEGDQEWQRPYGIGLVVFALGLQVVAATLGWPQRTAIDQALV